MGDDGSGWGPPFLTPTRALAAVVALFVVLSSAVLLLTPPWEANDEPGHVHNVVTVANGEYYRIEPFPTHLRNEAHQPPLYYAVLAAWHRIWGLDTDEPAPVGAVGVSLFGEEPSYEHDHPGDAADERLVRVLRLPGVAMGATIVVLTYLTTKRLTDHPWIPVAAAATVATLPRFVFLSGVVNNDNLANLLGAALTYGSVRLTTDPPSSVARRRLAALGLGLLGGAMVITKLNGVPLGAGALLAVFLTGRRRGEAPAMVGLLAVGALLVCGWWFRHNLDTYGDPLASDASNEYLRPVILQRPEIPFGEYVFRRLPATLVDTFWYTSGWNQFRWPRLATLPFWALAIAPLLGFRRRPDEESPYRRRRALAVTAVIAAAAVLSLWPTGLANDALPLTVQGRLVLPGVAAIAALAAIGWERWRAPPWAAFALPLLGLAGTLYAIWDDVWRVYHR